MMQTYENRGSAGRALADRLCFLKGRSTMLVLGLPRGGVIVAAEVAARFHAELDVLVVRKLGIPGHEEVAMGAIASGDVEYLNRDLIESLGIGKGRIDQVRQKEREELKRREAAYRGDRPPAEVSGRTVIVVDDGAATGATLQAAIAAMREKDPAMVIAAVPVAPPDAVDALESVADRVICPLVPEQFSAVGQWYRHFDQTTDEEVRRTLREAWGVRQRQAT
jgi:putative phosphoribosyl transferase